MMETGSPGEELNKLLKTVTEAAAQLQASMAALKEHALTDAAPPHKGMSLLSVKNHQLLDYLINLAHIVSLKLAGRPISGHPAVLRLAELRTVLERIRPMEQKLQYQMDKLLRLLSSEVTETDAMFHKPRPDNMVPPFLPTTSPRVVPLEAESSGSEDEGGEGKKSGKYAPPKLVAMPYQEEVGERGDELRKDKEAAKRRLSRSIIAELQQQYGDAPDEIHEVEGAGRRADRLAAARKKTEFEEENFVRVQMTGKQKHEARKTRGEASLDSILGFSDFGSVSKRRNPSKGPIKGTKGKRKGSFKSKTKSSKKRARP